MFDAMFSMYLIVFNEFNDVLGAEPGTYSQLPDNIRWFLWLKFIAVSILFGIIFFNTTVSVIGNTYNRMMVDAKLYGYQERNNLLSWYIFSLPLKEMDSYFYVIRPKSEEDKPVIGSDFITETKLQLEEIRKKQKALKTT